MKSRHRYWIGVVVAEVAILCVIIITFVPKNESYLYGLKIGMTRQEVLGILDWKRYDYRYARIYGKTSPTKQNNPLGLIRRYKIRDFYVAKRETRVTFHKDGEVETIVTRWILNKRFSKNF
jgi:hypothetical protein